MINEKDTVAGGRCMCGCGEPGMEPLQMYFSVIYRHGRVMHDKAMEQFGLTGQQMGYLKNINAAPGLSQEELAKQMHIDKGAVAKSLKVLVKKGYVIRNAIQTTNAHTVCFRQKRQRG